MPTVHRIDDPDDPRVAAYRDIRERDLVGREGLFVAEGEVVLNVLVRASRHRAVSLLLAEPRLARLEPIWRGLPDDIPVYAASQAVLDRIAGFPLHRGILAIGRRAPERSVADVLAACGPTATVVVLVGIANHDNMGGIFRNAAAFGADAVILDAGSCDPLYRKAIRVSVGATLIVPTARLPAGGDPVETLRAAGFEPSAFSPVGRTDLADWSPPARSGLVFGTEGAGLPEDILARAASLGIPMAGGFDSLNVATTSGIVLHHVAAARRTP